MTKKITILLLNGAVQTFLLILTFFVAFIYDDTQLAYLFEGYLPEYFTFNTVFEYLTLTFFVFQYVSAAYFNLSPAFSDSDQLLETVILIIFSFYFLFQLIPFSSNYDVFFQPITHGMYLLSFLYYITNIASLCRHVIINGQGRLFRS